MAVSAVSERLPTLLIVESSPENVTLLADLLSDVAKILFTRTGSGVYPLLEKHEIDLVLLEANLPDISGFEICQRLKSHRHHQHVQIFFVTSRDEAQDEHLGLSLGAMDYITKPIDPISLRHRIINHLRYGNLRHELGGLMTLDKLTGIGNRVLFFEDLARELTACQRQQRQCSLIVIDIDHFKRINRNFGPLMADKVLIQIARSLREHIPFKNWLYRLGDDEFALILPDLNLDNSCLLAEQLRLNIREDLYGYGLDQFILTASFGVAQAVPSELYSHFYLRADTALQTAKNRGRNRVDRV